LISFDVEDHNVILPLSSGDADFSISRIFVSVHFYMFAILSI
jgi:hypothetical protein